MAKLSATALGFALIDYRADLIRLQAKFSSRLVTAECDSLIKSIDDVLHEIDWENVTEVMISPTYKANV